MLISLLVVGFLGTISQAAPIADPGATLGVKFDARRDGLPTLTLPDAVYKAAGYDVQNDVGSSLHLFTSIAFWC